MGTLADLAGAGGPAGLGPRDPHAARRRRGAGPPARDPRRPAPPRDRRAPTWRRRWRPCRRATTSTTTPRGMLRLAMRDRDRALRVPESLVREISEACSRCVSAVGRGPRGRRLRRLRRPAGRRRGAQAPRGRGRRRRRRALRRPPRRVRARRARRRPGAGVRRPAGPPHPPGRRAPRSGRRWTCRRATGAAAARWPWPTRSRRLVGFDESRGVIALSAHPFTSSPHRGDVRFTTRLMPDSPIGSISAVLHELGHALYEQGLTRRATATPRDGAARWGSTSPSRASGRTMIGRSPAVLGAASSPALQAAFPGGAGRRRAEALLPRRQRRPALADPRRGRRGHLQPAHHPALRAGAARSCAADLPGGRPAGRCAGRGCRSCSGIRPPTDARGRAAGRPLGRRAVRLLPDLRARQPLRRAVHGDPQATFPTWTPSAAGELRREGVAQREDPPPRRLYRRRPLRLVTGKPLSADALVGHLTRVVDGA